MGLVGARQQGEQGGHGEGPKAHRGYLNFNTNGEEVRLPVESAFQRSMGSRRLSGRCTWGQGVELWQG